ncbi:transcription factor bHLH149 [Syzygium oleosum]|uniref:transcription factor bHLH149 n=1 Tax=Syzygium oleosum TaxID=219896 RepID=UPI0024B9165A|nr:transcription factor bHLH149 [Syzygium oleosum]
MASSSPAFNSDPDPDPAADAHRKKRRKIEADAEESDRDRGPAAGSEIRWRSPAQQRLYSAKLVEALSRSRRSSSSSSSSSSSAGGADAEPAAAAAAAAAPAPPSSGAGEVRGIVDRVLATAAKGRTRWSRAILASRLRMSRLGKRHKKARAPTGHAWLRKPPPPRPEGGKRRLPAAERRVRVLGRLVPGCRGISVSNLLEETSDYIAALEMQVRAMTVLTQLLSGSQPPSDRLGLGSGSG